MFFRRLRPRVPAFAERVEGLRTAGFTVAAAGGGVRVSRGACAVTLVDGRVIERAGLAMGDEIAQLVDGGFQKFFRAPSGRSKPALAEELEALHAFDEDVREALGMESRYNQSLGTVCTYSQYDRLRGRDEGGTV